MSHRDRRLLDLHYCLPSEFLIAYPQPLYYQEEKRKIHRNTNALESLLSKHKTNDLLHFHRSSKGHQTSDIQMKTNRIMSIESLDHEGEFYMARKSKITSRRHRSAQMADGDKKNKHTSEEFFNKYMTQKDLVRPVSCKPISNDRLKRSSDVKSILPLNRASTWRKLRANITPSHYIHIQEFQRERQQNTVKPIPHPVMLSPSNPDPDINCPEPSKRMSNDTASCMSSLSLSIASSVSWSEPSSACRIAQLIDDDHSNTIFPMSNSFAVEHQSKQCFIQNIAIDDDVKSSNNVILHSLRTSSNNILKDDLSLNSPIRNLPIALSSSHKNDVIEEFQPMIELLSPSQVSSVFLNDIFSSFFPSIPTLSSNNNPHVFHPHPHHTNNDISESSFMLFDNITDMTELLIIGQPPPLPPSLIEPDFFSEDHRPEKVHSFSESIEELCLLIRKLLQYEINQQETTFLQATITNQLAILLTYLAIPSNNNFVLESSKKDTVTKMTTTDERDFSSPQLLVSTVATQTDLEWIGQLNTQSFKTILKSSTNTHDFVGCAVKELSLVPKTASHTELLSTSVTLNLPGRRLKHALSDTFLNHIRHHQQYSSSHHKLISLSETTIQSFTHHFHRRQSTKEQTQRLLKCIEQKFQHYVELESSNTHLEASTEFTPDFLIPTLNNSKYDADDDDETEQFGIDLQKQDSPTNTVSMIIHSKEEKTDTLTFNSTERENYDSLDLEIDQENEVYPLFTSINDLNQTTKSSITGFSNYCWDNINCESLDGKLPSPTVNQLPNRKCSCQLLEPLQNRIQWQAPVLPRKSNSFDSIYEKLMAKIDFKHLKIRIQLNDKMNIVGKRVLIKSNSSSRASTPTNKLHSRGEEQSRKSSAFNYNNNCHSTESFTSSTSMDSLYSLDSVTLEKHRTDQSEDIPLLSNNPQSDELVLRSSRASIDRKYEEISNTTHLSEVTDKLDSNIALAESLLDMLDSLNNHTNNSSTMKVNLLHMYMKQFLIQFDTRIRLDRSRKKNSKRKH